MVEKKSSRGGIFHLLIVAIGLMVLMIALSVWSLVSYRQDLSGTLADMTRRNLERATDQSILLFDNMVVDSFRHLDTVAQFCGSVKRPTDQEVEELLHRNNEESMYVRLGISDLDGKLYVGTGSPIDISRRDYFKRALAGERVISEVISNNYNERDVIVFAVPITKDGETLGVACAQYEVQMFTDLLGNSQFEGIGATMVMQKNGRMASSFPGMENFGTFYEALTQMEFRGGDTLASLRQRVENNESGSFTYYRDGKARYLFFRPTGINDYVMLSLVMAESMDRDARAISGEALRLMIKNLLFYTIILACIWAISILVRRLIRDYQKDPLTQTYNKVSAQAAVERYLRGQGRNGIHACFFLDIDNFKDINDQYGHGSGDKLLILLSRKLTENFRNGDIICRFGGDEFLMFMKDVPDLAVAEKKAELICNSANGIGGFPVSVSVGIACFPRDGSVYADLIRHADDALYQAKKCGKNQYRVYSPDQS